MAPATSNTCYTSAGETVPSAQRCAAAPAGHSSCCGAGHVCLDNGLCLGSSAAAPNILEQASCTDPTYADTAACPQYCATPSTPLFLVSLSPDGKAQYCCGAGLAANGTCAQGPVTPFNVPNGKLLWNNAASAQDTSAPTIIGAAVGIPLAILLLIAILLWVVEHRHRVRLSQKWERWSLQHRSSLSTLDRTSPASTQPRPRHPILPRLKTRRLQPEWPCEKETINEVHEKPAVDSAHEKPASRGSRVFEIGGRVVVAEMAGWRGSGVDVDRR